MRLFNNDIVAKVNVQIIDEFVAMRQYISSILVKKNFINCLVYKHDEEMDFQADIVLF